MPTRPYAINNQFTANTFNNRTFSEKRALLGELISGEMDYSQLINSIPSTLLQLYQAGRQADVQSQLIDLNIQRAQRGLSPITLNQVGGAALASPNVGTTLSLSEDTKQLLIYGAAGLAGIYFLSKKKRGRR